MSADVISIVGGGPVGVTFALLLAQQGIAARVYESRPAGDAHHDQRALALSYGSRRIFERIGVWDEMYPFATAITTIHVSQKGGLGRSKLKASDHNLDALGYVVSYGAVAKALDNAIEAYDEISLYNETAVEAIEFENNASVIHIANQTKEACITSRLSVIADGGRSLETLTGVRRVTKEYGHDAIVSKVTTELAHDGVAYERFTSSGPMALLPNGKRDFSLVWTGKKEEINALLALEDADFLQALHEQFGDRVGRFLSITKRLSFPLVKASINEKVTTHLAVIGNAAQTMHPVAGQGFNIGLRDAATLAKKLSEVPVEQWGTECMLNDYSEARKTDVKGGLIFTDFLVNIFSNDLVGVSAIRGIGLGLLDVLQPAKNTLVSKMSYGK